ncbi:MAG: lysylphosphatidylglycerol synthase transmembrane domain-containing protein [Steroidobacter sp.]
MTRGNRLRSIVGLLLAALFLWLTLRQVRLDGLHSALDDLDVRLIAVSLVAAAVGYAFRIERWRLMLTSAGTNLRWKDCAGPLLASFAANNVLPLRAGDVMRCFAFNTRLGTTSGVVVATVFVERLLDLIVILALFGVTLLVFSMDAAAFLGVGGVALLFVAAVAVFVLLFPRVIVPIARAVGGWVARRWPTVGRKIADEVEKSLMTLEHLADRRRMVTLLLWSAAIWIAEGCAYWLAAASLPSLTNALAAWIALPVGALATLLPSAPGYVGTFHYFVVRAMTALGNETAAATVFAFSIHLIVLLPSTLGGCFYLLKQGHGAKAAPAGS